MKIEDGFVALRKELSVGDIARLIERTARWVAPETFRLLPVWYPEFSRRSALYDARWQTPRTNRNRGSGLVSDKIEGNTQANTALTKALGFSRKDRPNWSCCHIWGVDDPTFSRSNSVVADPRFFSCVGNMVLLPTPLKAFTDAMPEIKAMLRIGSSRLYNWTCDHPDIAVEAKALESFQNWADYPASWPRPGHECRPIGTTPCTPGIERSAKQRLRRIAFDMANAGEKYPREQVKSVLAYWKIDLPDI